MEIDKDLKCHHNWEPTDSQGYTMECSGCGIQYSFFDLLFPAEAYQKRLEKVYKNHLVNFAYSCPNCKSMNIHEEFGGVFFCNTCRKDCIEEDVLHVVYFTMEEFSKLFKAIYEDIKKELE